MLTRSKTRRLTARSAWSIPPRDMQPVEEMVGQDIVLLERGTEWLRCGDFWDLDEMEGAVWEPQIWVVPGSLIHWNGRFDSLPKHHSVLLTHCPFTLLLVDPAAMKYLEDNFEITHDPNRWAHYTLDMLDWSRYHTPGRVGTPGVMPKYPGTRFIHRHYHMDIPRHPAKPVLYVNLCDWGSLTGRVCSNGYIRCD